MGVACHFSGGHHKDLHVLMTALRNRDIIWPQEYFIKCSNVCNCRECWALSSWNSDRTWRTERRTSFTERTRWSGVPPIKECNILNGQLSTMNVTQS